MKLATKSNHSETEFEDKDPELNLDEYFDTYIFGKNPQIHELTMTERIRSPSEVFGIFSNKIQEDYLQNSPRSLLSPTEVSVDESVTDVKRLLLSDMHNQRSRYDRVTWPFPMDNKDEMKPEKVDKLREKYQIQAVLIECLWQFLQKTALPKIQKYEQLQKKYSTEKTE